MHQWGKKESRQAQCIATFKWVEIKSGREQQRQNFYKGKPREKIVIHSIATQSELSVEPWRSPKPVLFYFVILIWHLILKSETLPHSWHTCSWESKSVKEYLSNRPYLKHLNTGKLTGNQTWPMLLQTPANLHWFQESRNRAEVIIASQQENSLESGLIQKKKIMYHINIC